MGSRRLMAVLAHPDDESLGMGGTLAKYAREDVDVFLLTATRGDPGRFRGRPSSDPDHRGPSALASISKLYYLAWPTSTYAAYQSVVGRLSSTVDGVERTITPWPDWAITTAIDTRHVWATVWRAVSCHESQLVAYERFKALSPEHHESLWGHQSFYRVFSTVNGGRACETDLFEGIQ